MNDTKQRLTARGLTRYKHQLIAADILERIRCGELKKGSKIPSVDELEAGYPYSRMTIFKALQELTRRGFLRTERGVGTFVERGAGPCGCAGLIIGEDVLHPQTTPWPYLLLRGLREFFARRDCLFKMYVELPEDGHRELPVDGFSEDLRKGIISGVIVAHCNVSGRLAKSKIWAQKQIPLVDITDRRDAPYRVTFDHETFVSLAIECCLRKSRRRLAAICVGNGGFLKVCAEKAGIRIRPEWTANVSADDLVEKQGYEAMLELWRNTDKPNALLIGDDVAAKGVLQATARLGISAPKDLLIMTHANRDSGIFYPVDTVRIEFNIDECASLAGSMLLDMIGNPALPPQTATVRPRLIFN